MLLIYALGNIFYMFTHFTLFKKGKSYICDLELDFLVRICLLVFMRALKEL